MDSLPRLKHLRPTLALPIDIKAGEVTHAIETEPAQVGGGVEAEPMATNFRGEPEQLQMPGEGRRGDADPTGEGRMAAGLARRKLFLPRHRLAQGVGHLGFLFG